MRRGEFIGLIGGTVATWPLPASAQQLEKLPTIGFLGSGRPRRAAHRIFAEVAQTRLDRGSQHFDRVSLGGGKQRDRAAELAADTGIALAIFGAVKGRLTGINI